MAAATVERPVVIHADAGLNADLAVPSPCRGVVVFAHGSGSSRQSTRNRTVAQTLQDAGFATLLMDLLTIDEERHDALGGRTRFDVELLASRLTAARGWVDRQPELIDLPVGYFGASTGAASALIAAAESAEPVAAIVSRGGRVDMAGARLSRVHCPVLLLVGGHDDVVLALNRDALAHLPNAELAVVPGATHLFAEPGALEVVAAQAREWFARHLSRRAPAPPT
ncbi:MAG: dienelactone hydrolase family protein [Jiangellaceae bacterium]